MAIDKDTQDQLIKIISDSLKYILQKSGGKDMQKWVDTLSKSQKEQKKLLDYMIQHQKLDEKSMKLRKERLGADADLNRSLFRTNKSMDDFSSKAKGAAQSMYDAFTHGRGGLSSLTTLLEGAAIGGVIHKFIDIADDQVTSYRELLNSGQSFGGSLINMDIAAANAGISLKSFADLVSRNSNIFSIIGTDDFGKLSKSLRNATKIAGDYGMTTDQLNETLAEYLETSRLQGIYNRKNQIGLTNNLNDLLGVTQSLSIATGRQRDQILKSVISNKQNNIALNAVIDSLPESIRGSVIKSVDNVSATLNAYLGDDAKEIIDQLGNAVFYNQGYITEFGKTLAAVAPAAGTAFDSLVKKIRAGTASQDDANAFLKALSMNGKDFNQVLAMLSSKGDAASLSVAKMIQELHNRNDDDAKAAAKQKLRMTDATNALLTFRDNLNLIEGDIASMLLPAIQTVADVMMSLKDNFEWIPRWANDTQSAWKRVTGQIAEFGLALSPLIAYLGFKGAKLFVNRGLQKMGYGSGNPLGSADARQFFKIFSKRNNQLSHFENPGTLKVSIYKVMPGAAKALGGGYSGSGGGGFGKFAKAEKELAEGRKVGKFGKFLGKFGKLGRGAMGALDLGSDLLGGNIGSVIESGLGYAEEAGTALASKAGFLSKIAGKSLLGAAKVAGPIGAVITVGMTAYDAYKGWNNAADLLKKDEKNITTGDKIAAAAGEGLNSLSLGLSDVVSGWFGFDNTAQALDKVKDSFTSSGPTPATATAGFGRFGRFGNATPKSVTPSPGVGNDITTSLSAAADQKADAQQAESARQVNAMISQMKESNMTQAQILDALVKANLINKDIAINTK